VSIPRFSLSAWDAMTGSFRQECSELLDRELYAQEIPGSYNLLGFAVLGLVNLSLHLMMKILEETEEEAVLEEDEEGSG